MNNKKVSLNQINLQDGVRSFFSQIGLNPEDDGIKETPWRFEEAVKYLLGGYSRSFDEENKVFLNNYEYKEIITSKNIDFFSLCEHHLLPFFGYIHIGYIPGNKVLGISKLARAVDIYARRLQDQERLGTQIADCLMEAAKAKGVAVLIEGKHFCNIARGVEKKMSVMTTMVFKGDFEDSDKLRNTFFRLVENRERP